MLLLHMRTATHLHEHRLGVPAQHRHGEGVGGRTLLHSHQGVHAHTPRVAMTVSHLRFGHVEMSGEGREMCGKIMHAS